MSKKGIIGMIIAIIIVIVAIAGFIIYSKNNTSNENDSNVVANTSITNNNRKVTNKDNTSSSGKGKILLAYYSAQSHTKTVAEKIAENLNADIFEIVPEDIYTEDDLDWTDRNPRVSKEHDNEDLRAVKLQKDTVDNWEDYDTVLIGYPIWWSDLPQILYTFLESYDFAGKNVYLFSTNGGSGLAGTVSTITEKLNTTKVSENAFKLNRDNIEDAPEEVEKWLKQIDIID